LSKPGSDLGARSDPGFDWISDMFLDDINRKNNKAKKHWEAWDKHEYVDVHAHEAVVTFIDLLRLLCVKNIGEADVTLDIHGMRTKLLAGDEKYFTDPSGRQMVCTCRKGKGRLFVGQSQRNDVTTMPGVLLLLSIGLSLVVLSGCVSCEVEHSRRSCIAPMPASPSMASVPKTPHAPRTAPMPRTPKDPVSYD